LTVLRQTTGLFMLTNDMSRSWIISVVRLLLCYGLSFKYFITIAGSEFLFQSRTL